MSYFAQIDSNNNVLQVIVADQAFINTGAVGDPTMWIQCSDDGSTNNGPYPGPGYTWDPVNKLFVTPSEGNV